MTGEAQTLNPNDEACKKLWRDEGGSLDLETRCMQENAERQRGITR